jgi:hypothetical protein
VKEENEPSVARYDGAIAWRELIEPVHSQELRLAEKIVGLPTGQLSDLIVRAQMAVGSAAESFGKIRIPIEPRKWIVFEAPSPVDPSLGYRFVVVTNRTAFGKGGAE